MSDHDEIIRLRDRLHNLEGTVSGLVHSQRDLRAGLAQVRDAVQDFSRDIRGLRRDVDNMAQADEIAQAVTEAVRSDRRRSLSRGQKVVAALTGTLLLIPSLTHVWGWFA